MADLDRERLLKWIIAWCGLSTAWSLSSNDTVSTTIKVAELAMTELNGEEVDNGGNGFLYVRSSLIADL
jgi:streptomycin 6-kinase